MLCLAFRIFLTVFTGLMTTVSLPVYGSSGNFVGVVGVDITLADLFSDVDYFQQGVNSYAFVIDNVGTIV